MNFTERSAAIATRADELGIDPFTAYTIADDAIDYLDDIDEYHRTDAESRALIATIILHFQSDDDFDDLRHELRHEWDMINREADPSGLDLCDNCGECDYCCDCE